MRQIHFVPEAWAQYTYWHGHDAKSDRKTLKRINLLTESAAREPFEGIGKPEPLVGNLSGYWSRRIDEAHRLVYRATDGALIVVACRYHYGQ
jgi:toxin YoeB